MLMLMVTFMNALFAMGPVGGIDSSVGARWAIIWTVILGGLLYGSVMAFPQWVDLGDEGKS